MPSQTGFASKPPRTRLYLDESGDHTYELLKDPARRYLSLLGVWFHKDYYATFVEELERFKREIFGFRPDHPVILHRNDIINRRGPFGILCQPEKKARFETGLLDVIRRAQFWMVCVIIDKRAHWDRYTSPFHPYHYCLAALLERYCGWLQLKNATGDVMAESRGREEDIQLKQAYLHVYESGTRYIDRGKFQRVLTSHEIKVRGKGANIAGLQLADLLAYPVKQACLVEHKFVSDPGQVFGKKLLEAVQDKFNRNLWTGEVWGYGKVWLPVALSSEYRRATADLTPYRKIPPTKRGPSSEGQ